MNRAPHWEIPSKTGISQSLPMFLLTTALLYPFPLLPSSSYPCFRYPLPLSPPLHLLILSSFNLASWYFDKLQIAAARAKCMHRRKLAHTLRQVLADGGEGVMLRKP